MSALQQTLDAIETRLAKKLKRAETAYIKQHTQKISQNCGHYDREVSDGLVVCKMQCIGENEAAASTCWAEKAAWCTKFKLKRSVQQLRLRFKQLSKEELRLRWPSINELYWTQELLKEQIQKETPVNKEPNS